MLINPESQMESPINKVKSRIVPSTKREFKHKNGIVDTIKRRFGLPLPGVVAQGVKDSADGMLLFKVVPHRELWMDGIGIAPAGFMTDGVSLGHQVVNNFLNCSLSDADFPGNLPTGGLWVLRDVNEHSTVIGQESPLVRFQVFFPPVNNLTWPFNIRYNTNIYSYIIVRILMFAHPDYIIPLPPRKT